MNILVTGASGFIGSRLLIKLVENGHSVTGICNQHSIENHKVKIIRYDLTKPELNLPNEQYDIVYHLAAITPLEKDKNVLKKVNFDGTMNIFEKIKDKTKFFVYISGLGVFGDVNEIISEETQLKPHTEYARIRLEVQKTLEKKCKDSSISLSIAYLGEVYGNGGWFASQVLDRLKKGRFKFPNKGEYYRSVVHVDDVVSALVEIGEKNIINESFIITDSKPIVFKEFINYICDALNFKHPGNVPSFLASALLGGDALKLLTTSNKASNQKIAKLVEFKYPTYKEGLDVVFSEIK